MSVAGGSGDHAVDQQLAALHARRLDPLESVAEAGRDEATPAADRFGASDVELVF